MMMENFEALIGSTVANQYTLQRLASRLPSHCLFEASRRTEEPVHAGFARFGVKRTRHSQETPERGLLVITASGSSEERNEVLSHWKRWRINGDPSLIACHDTDAISDGPLEGAIFAFTEFGITLGAAINDENVSRDELFRVFRSVASGLASFHSHGATHGGVSAWSIVNVDGRWKLALSSNPIRVQNSAADDVIALAVVVAISLIHPENEHAFDPYRLSPEQLHDLRQRVEHAVEEQPYRTLLLRCLDASKERRPPASVLAEEPLSVPEPLRNVSVQRQGGKCSLSWSSPENGVVQFIKVADVRTVQEGTLILAGDIPALGQSLAGSAANTIELTLGDNQSLAIVPVTVRGALAAVGHPLVIGSLEDVTIQQVDVDRGEVVIQLRWPPNVQNALIVMRPDRFPDGPNDLHATTRPYPRGNRILQAVRIPVQSWEHAFISVFSMENIGDQTVYSPGTTESCRRRVDVSSYRRITYSVVSRRSLPFAPSNLFDLRIVTDIEMDLPPLVLVGKRGRIPPAYRNDGVPLVEISGGELCGPGSLLVECEGLERPFAVKLFPRDDKLAQWLQLRFASELVFT